MVMLIVKNKNHKESPNELIDFIITVFCKIDDMLKDIFKNNRLRQRGPQPKLSDSEVITIEIVGEFLGKDCDEDIHAYFKTHWSNLFPCISERSVFVRQSANLWAVKQKLRQQFLATLFSENAGLRIIDGLPMPVCDPDGVIVDMTVTAANVDEREASLIWLTMSLSKPWETKDIFYGNRISKTFNAAE